MNDFRRQEDNYELRMELKVKCIQEIACEKPHQRVAL